MAKLKPRWTGTALAEFGRMLTFYNIRNGNDKYSRTIIRMVNESLKLIVKFPRMYRLVDAEEVKDIRMFHCDYFLIYYKVKDSEVTVEAVLTHVKTLKKPLTNRFLSPPSYHQPFKEEGFSSTFSCIKTNRFKFYCKYNNYILNKRGFLQEF